MKLVKTSAAHRVFLVNETTVVHDLRAQVEESGLAALNKQQISDATLEALGLPGSLGKQLEDRAAGQGDSGGLVLQTTNLHHSHVASVSTGIFVSSTEQLDAEETRRLARELPVVIDKLIPDTTLRIVALVYRHEESMHDGEIGDLVNVFEVVDEKTGECGLLKHSYGWHKRDIESEELWVSNPALFKDNHPEGDWHSRMCDLNRMQAGSELEVGMEEPACAHQVVYEKDKAGKWGYRLKA